MDFNGCPENFARDNILTIGATTGNMTNKECLIPVAFYIVYMSCCTTIIFIVVAGKTRLIFKQQRALRKDAKKYSTTKAMQSIAGALVRMTSFVCSLFLTFAPFVPYFNGNNSIMVLLGLQMTLFVISAERWLSKLIRLGKRIIPKHYQTDSSSLVGHDPEGDSLKRADSLLVILDLLSWICIIVMFVTMCVLSEVFNNDRLLLNLGVGALGVSVATLTSGIDWQYQRCIIFIRKSHQALMGVALENNRLLIVVKMFKLQQQLLFLFGTLGTVIYLLYATETIRMNWTLLIVTNTFDAMITGSILFTYVVQKGKNLSKPKSKEDKLALKVHNIEENVENTKRFSEAKTATAPQDHE